MDLNGIVADKTLDMTGLSCPMPLLLTKKTLSKMAAGEVVEVISSDPGSQNDLPRFGDRAPNTYLGNVTDPNGICKYYIQKG